VPRVIWALSRAREEENLGRNGYGMESVCLTTARLPVTREPGGHRRRER
jgi:hypothetical protein